VAILFRGDRDEPAPPRGGARIKPHTLRDEPFLVAIDPLTPARDHAGEPLAAGWLPNEADGRGVLWLDAPDA